MFVKVTPIRPLISQSLTCSQYMWHHVFTMYHSLYCCTVYVWCVCFALLIKTWIFRFDHEKPWVSWSYVYHFISTTVFHVILTMQSIKTYIYIFINPTIFCLFRDLMLIEHAQLLQHMRNNISMRWLCEIMFWNAVIP